MKSTGRYCPVTDGFDLDEAINEECQKVQGHIDELRDKLNPSEFKKVVKNIIEVYLTSI